MLGGNQWLKYLGTVPSSVLNQFITDNRAALEPAREQLPPNVRRQMSAGRQLTATLFLRADQRGKPNALAAVAGDGRELHDSRVVHHE